MSRTALLALLLASPAALCQSSAPAATPTTQPTQPQQTAPQPAQPPQGQVLFERHTAPAPDTTPDTAPANTTHAAAPAAKDAASDTTSETAAQTDVASLPKITSADRSALHFTAYDLDVRLKPDAGALAVRALLTVRNAGTAPLTHLALQISSSLRWQSIVLTSSHAPATFVQHKLDTDADHTGAVTEAIVTLPTPLAPGATLALDTLYDGTIRRDATRLLRIGAGSAQAASTDWDEISASTTALRGFGNVAWYPVTSPALFLGDGARLFEAVAAARARDQHATFHLHLAVEYHGDPPVAAYFCGLRQPLHAQADDVDAPMAYGNGIASADFASAPIGFRLPSLFVLNQAEQLTAPLPIVNSEPTPTASSSSSSSSTASTSNTDASASTANDASPAPAAIAAKRATTAGPAMLAVETDDPRALPRLADAAEGIAPLIEQWFGTHPLSTLTVLDHTGEPFEDGPFVVAPLGTLAASSSTDALAHSMTHAWVQTGQPWMDEGLAQFVALLWNEQQQGRAAMVAQLTDLLRPLTLAEPAITKAQLAAAVNDPDAQPLGPTILSSPDELYYRRKSAAVWMMLRGIVGDDALAAALTAWRMQPPSHEPPATQAVAFEHLLEQTSHKDLTWFFRDWVLHDRGLPDLSIVDATPRLLPAGQGHDSGWLVAVTVHNDGAAEVEVPVVIRSDTFSVTRRMRVPAFGNVTDRIVVEAAPTEVVVNDGTTPEVESSIHHLAIHQQPPPADLMPSQPRP